MSFGSKVRRGVLIALTAVVTGLVVLVAIRGKSLGAPTSAVLQGAGVVLSVYGGVVFTREGNDQHLRAVARASARRVLVTYQSLGELVKAITGIRNRFLLLVDEGKIINPEVVDVALEGLENQVLAQIASADSAIQDWRDLAPDEVDQEVDRIRGDRSQDV